MIRTFGIGLLLALALALVLVPPASAGCGYRPSYYYPTYYEPVYVQPLVVPLVTVSAVVPAYGTALVTPPTVAAAAAPAAAPAPVAAAPAPETCEQRLAKVLNRLEAVEARLSGGGGGPPDAPPAQKDPAAAALTVLTNHCAKCHTQGHLDKDTTFSMFDAGGKLANLDVKYQLGIMKRIGRPTTAPGAMPKGGPQLSDDELVAVNTYLDSLK